MSFRALRLYTRKWLKSRWERTVEKWGPVMAALVGAVIVGACLYCAVLIVVFLTGE